MEGNTDMNSGGVAVRGNDAPDSFRVAARLSTDNNPPSTTHPEAALQPTTNVGVTTAPTFIPAAAPNTVATTTAIAVSNTSPYGIQVKKKRGRPRKYPADGSAAPVPVSVPAAATLSPMPLSASIPLAGAGEFSGWKQQARVKPFQAIKKAHKVETEIPGDNKMAFVMGGNFTPHVITVLAGEDVAMKIHSFSQQESRAICILSASGSISNVTLRQPNSSGGTLTYEGRFEILSLSGSFMPTENGLLKSRSGGMSVSLAGPDGQVLGGGLAGLLIASSPVQVVLGSFAPSRHLEPKQRKQRMEPTSVPTPTATFTTTTIHHHQEPPTAQWGGGGGSVSGGGGYGSVQNLNFSSPPPIISHHTDPFAASTYSTHNYRDVETDQLSSEESDEGESDDDSGSKFEISG